MFRQQAAWSERMIILLHLIACSPTKIYHPIIYSCDTLQRLENGTYQLPTDVQGPATTPTAPLASFLVRQHLPSYRRSISGHPSIITRRIDLQID
jgi:hypothetical protein